MSEAKKKQVDLSSIARDYYAPPDGDKPVPSEPGGAALVDFNKFGPQRVSRYKQASLDAGSGGRGPFLKFDHGNWNSNKVPVSKDDKFVVYVDQSEWGLVCWVGGQWVKEHVGPVGAYQPPERETLDYFEPSTWPDKDDQTGQPRDPYQLTWYVKLGRMGSFDTFTWAFSTWGGRNAWRAFLDIVDIAEGQGQGGRPIVTLGTRKRHYAKRRADVDEPALNIVGWTEPPPEKTKTLAEFLDDDLPQSLK